MDNGIENKRCWIDCELLIRLSFEVVKDAYIFPSIENWQVDGHYLKSQKVVIKSFILKEIDETIVVKQFDKDLSLFEDLLEAHAFDDIQLLVINDTDVTAFFQDEAFDDDFLRL